MFVTCRWSMELRLLVPACDVSFKILVCRKNVLKCRSRRVWLNSHLFYLHERCLSKILVYWKKVLECRRANPFTDLDVKSMSHALNVMKVLKNQVGCLYNVFFFIITDSVPRLLNYWNFLLAITVLISCSSGFGHSWFWCFHVSRKFINLYILIISFSTDRKQHRNGIHRPKTYRYPSMKGVSLLFHAYHFP